MKRVGLFLATEKGYEVLSAIRKSELKHMIVFVCSFKEVNVVKSWHEDIRLLCEESNIPYLSWEEYKRDISKNENDEYACDCLIAIGWKYILNDKFSQSTESGVIVFHDSLLPKYRGFAPTPTAIINGDNEVGVTVLKAGDKGVDSGEILLQRSVNVEHEDYIQDVIEKEKKVYAELFIELLQLIKKGDGLQGKKQDENNATYSIWRDVLDCEIDWNDSAEKIYNLIRAVSKPYMGAYFKYEGSRVIINKAETVTDMNFEIRNPGKIWRIEDGHPYVICGTGMLKILDAEYENGVKMAFDRVRVRLG